MWYNNGKSSIRRQRESYVSFILIFTTDLSIINFAETNISLLQTLLLKMKRNFNLKKNPWHCIKIDIYYTKICS